MIVGKACSGVLRSRLDRHKVEMFSALLVAPEIVAPRGLIVA